jgi:hypothetical protein
MEEKLFVCDANLHRRTRAIDVLCDLDILSERKREQIIFLLLSNNLQSKTKTSQLLHTTASREIRERAIMSVVCAVDCANVKYLLHYYLWLLRELTAHNMREADARSLMEDPPQRACNAGSSE